MILLVNDRTRLEDYHGAALSGIPSDNTVAVGREAPRFGAEADGTDRLARRTGLWADRPAGELVRGTPAAREDRDSPVDKARNAGTGILPDFVEQPLLPLDSCSGNWEEAAPPPVAAPLCWSKTD
jgi:hypothetical protein